MKWLGEVDEWPEDERMVLFRKARVWWIRGHSLYTTSVPPDIGEAIRDLILYRDSHPGHPSNPVQRRVGVQGPLPISCHCGRPRGHLGAHRKRDWVEPVIAKPWPGRVRSS